MDPIVIQTQVFVMRNLVNISPIKLIKACKDGSVKNDAKHISIHMC